MERFVKQGLAGHIALQPVSIVRHFYNVRLV
jgi:hypothetical protein